MSLTVHEEERSSTQSWRRYLVSPDAYLISILVTAVVAAYVNYLRDRVDPGGWLIYGQSPGVYIPFLLFPITLVLWLMCREWAERNRWSIAFLVGMAVSWGVHFAIIQIHGDLYVHAIWLFLPVVLLLLIKPPTWQAARQTLQVLAWRIVGIAALTFFLERLGVVPQFFVGGEELIAWEQERYWLPLQGLLGVEGRWPGPFGANQKTAFLAVIAIIIGLTNSGWRRLVLTVGGVVILFMTGSRGGFFALAVGLFVLVAFSRHRIMERIPAPYRIGAAVLVLLGVAFVIINQSGLGLTGRSELWAGFLGLWESSPVIGVGQVGISSAPVIVTWMDPSWMDAHSVYVQQITRYGVIGSLLAFGTLLVGVVAALFAAIRRWVLPLAVISSYLAAGVTDFLHDGWQLLSTHVVMVLTAVLGAMAWNRNHVESTGDVRDEKRQRETS